MRDRFQWWAPWSLPTPWRPLLFRGCDEWHNRSVVVGFPFLGAVVVFWERAFDRTGPEHLHGFGPDGWLGDHSPACLVCVEMKDDAWDEKETP